MQTYLVGGAVRDKLLELPVRERDWVVVGATPEEMLALGYQAVGKDFPVFLHPETKEEYVLARTERKTGHGYTGFETCSDPGITLEQDLQRRDLTINAMAETADGELIDPCNGAEDLGAGLLKHVSPAFVEDPVRILRVARFAARFARQGFKVAHDTNKLMRQMVENGEIDHLVAERVCTELLKALSTDTPSRFFRALHGCGALGRLFPEIEPLFATEGEPAHADANPLMTLDTITGSSGDTVTRFAALIADIVSQPGSPFTTGALAKLCERLRLPNAHRELAVLVVDQLAATQAIADADAETVFCLLESTDALRRPERFAEFLNVCVAHAAVNDRQAADDLLLHALAAIAAVQADQLSGDLKGPAIGAALRAARIEAIKQLL